LLYPLGERNRSVRIGHLCSEAPGKKYSDFKRWLEKQGVRFAPGKGSHLHVELNGLHSVFPFHGAKEIPAPLANAIKKDLGLK